MVEASVTFAVGGEQATVVLPVDLPVGEMIITGDFGGVVPAGTTARLRGSVRLIDNLHVRGTLVCDPTGVDLDGQNLYDIHTHDGTLNLVGVEKTAWCRWGDDPIGWEIGDRLAIAPTAAGVYVPSEGLWTGDWDTMIRPPNSPNVNLPPNPYLMTARPEVANLSQKVTLRNLKRIMIHEASAPNPQTLKWIRVLNSGETGVLGNYPIHFHMIGDHARGSLIEGVVVEGGRNHAVVPHGSHGITLKDDVAYNTIGDAFWWDPPENNNLPSLNDSHDTVSDHCLALWIPGPTVPTAHVLTGFRLGRGLRNRCIDSVAACVHGGKTSSGFHWPELGVAVWDFHGCLAHNVRSDAIFSWPNSGLDHVVEGFIGYNFGRTGIEHGAYLTQFVYRTALLIVGNPIGGNGPTATAAIRQHANGRGTGLLFEDIVTNDRLIVNSHGNAPTAWTTYRRCQVTGVFYDEATTGGAPIFRSQNRFEDCGLTPADFTLLGILPDSVIEIFEAGTLTDRWVNGAWT